MATRSNEGLEALLLSVGADGPVPAFPLADVLTSPMTIYLSYLADTLVQLSGCEAEHAYDSIQWPNDFCDLAVVVPRLRLKDSSPTELAAELKKTFPPNSLFAHPFEDGINLRFLFNQDNLAKVLLPYILDRGPSYGAGKTNGLIDSAAGDDSPRKKVVVEFSSPNLGKEFDGLHLRSTIIGSFIASMYESMGWEVVRVNFLGDWGKHIGVLAAGWSRFGSEDLFAADPIRHLLDVFMAASALLKSEQAEIKKAEDPAAAAALENEGISGEKEAFFKKLEDRDPDTLALWKRFRDVCISGYTELYERLSIAFDEYSGESQVAQETISEVESSLKEKGVYHESDLAWVIDLQNHGPKGLGTAIARYRNGTTSYLLRDVATVIERSRKHAFDKMVYVVSSKQDLHFQQLFATIELMGLTELAGKLQHVSFGPAKGLGRREHSSGLLLGDMLGQTKAAVDAVLESEAEDVEEFSAGDSKVSTALAASVLQTQELVHRRTTTVPFDLDTINTSDSHTGLALQQWYVSVVRRLSGSSIDLDELKNADFAMFNQDEYADVLRLLIQFPDTVKTSFRTHESSPVLGYLFRLTDALGGIWGEGEGDDEGGGSSSQQNVGLLGLLHCVRHVLENGMKMVGIVPISDGGEGVEDDGA